MLSQNIKRLRKQHKFSQEELAKRANITYSTLIKIESGANDNPTVKTLKKIATVFKISMDDLL